MSRVRSVEPAVSRVAVRHRTGNIADNGVDYSELVAKLVVGGNKGICTGCGRGFSSDTPFDRHQKIDKETAEVECHDPAEMGFVNRDGFWGMSDPKARGLKSTAISVTDRRRSAKGNENE